MNPIIRQTNYRPDNRRDTPYTHRRHPTTSERTYSDEETEFLLAMEQYQKKTGHKFPTWCEVLGVLKSMGYRRGPCTEVPADCPHQATCPVIYKGSA